MKIHFLVINLNFGEEWRIVQIEIQEYFPLYTLFGFFTRWWLLQSGYFHCARQPVPGALQTYWCLQYQYPGRSRSIFSQLNTVIKLYKQSKQIITDELMKRTLEDNGDKLIITKHGYTTRLSRAATRVRPITLSGIASLTGEQWELCERSVTMALGGRKPTPPQTCYRVILRSFKVSTVYWGCRCHADIVKNELVARV